jgi:hypothetical protein
VRWRRLAYNLSSHEKASDPAAVIEWLYLSLGHDRFMQSVLVFGIPQGWERWRFTLHRKNVTTR